MIHVDITYDPYDHGHLTQMYNYTISYYVTVIYQYIIMSLHYNMNGLQHQRYTPHLREADVKW